MKIYELAEDRRRFALRAQASNEPDKIRRLQPLPSAAARLPAVDVEAEARERLGTRADQSARDGRRVRIVFSACLAVEVSQVRR